MYSPQRRPRPWSPDPNDPLPTVSRQHVPNETGYDFDYEYSRYPQSDQSHTNPNAAQSRNQRREPSDVSVEALDLADYARTLHRNQHPPQRQWGHVPDNMLDSLHPPSLTYSSTSDASSSRNSRRSRRPFSLPSSSRNHSYQSFSNTRHQQQQHEPDFLAHEDEEIDISRFPAWSRGWYNIRNNTSSPQDIYSPLPRSQFDSVKYKSRHKSNNSNIFDPGNTWDRERDPFSTHNTRNSRDYSPNYWNDPPPPSSFSHESTRDLLPWNHDSRDQPIDPLLKEERMRMLEREFGPNAQASQRHQDPNSPFLLDENGKPLVGTVSPSGYIVTQGPRKRLFVRVMQVLLAGVAAIPAIYAAVTIKFTDEEVKKEGKPPPQGTAQSYVLYVMSVLWLAGLVVLFVFYPCCCGRRKKVKKDGMGMGPGGMIVLPVMQGLAGGKNGKKKAKGGKKKNKGVPGAPGDVQVNLIVDPTMFRGHEEEDPSDEDNTYDEFGERGSSASMPGGYGGGGGPRRKRKPKRRSVFVGLQMEEDWKKARGFMKKVTAVDIFGVIVWGGVFIFILLGKRCPTGGFKGWCNAYNTSSAAACLLCVAFGVSVFFDIKDLHASKESPRTRT